MGDSTLRSAAEPIAVPSPLGGASLFSPDIESKAPAKLKSARSDQPFDISLGPIELDIPGGLMTELNPPGLSGGDAKLRSSANTPQIGGK